MSAEHPTIVPRNADGIHRVIVIGRESSRQSFHEAKAHEPIDSTRRQHAEMIDRALPGPKIVTWLPPGRAGQSNPLAGLPQLVHAGQCDAIVVQSFCRLSRNAGCLWPFVEGLKTAGVRLISLSDQFDTSKDRWPNALAGFAVRRGFEFVS
jgi:hypothetical protein